MEQKKKTKQTTEDSSTFNSLEDVIIPPPENGKKKDKRGRKSNKSKEDEKNLKDTMNLAMGQIIELPFQVIARNTGHNHWMLKETEKVQLSFSLNLLVDKYIQDLGKYSVEILAGITILSIVIPRAIIEKDLRMTSEEDKDARIKREEIERNKKAHG